MSATIEDAMDVLGATSGLTEIVHPFHGGNHVFRYEEVEPGKPLVYLDMADQTFEMDQHAMLSAIKKIPGGSDKMVDNWPVFMYLEPLNWFFDHQQGDFKVLTLHDSIVSFTRPQTTLFNPQQVLEIMAEKVATHSGHTIDNIEVDGLVHSFEETAFTVVDPEGARFIEARQGDRTLGALGFHGSLLGRGPMELTVRTRRVVCRNGMVSSDGFSRFKIGGEEEGDDAEGGIGRLEEWLRSQTESLFNGEALQRELDRIQHLTVHEVNAEQTGVVLEDLFTRFNVAAGAQQEVLEALEEERDGTMYGIVQAFTRAAQHSPHLADGVRTHLMRHAGQINAHAEAICNECRRILP